MVKKCRNTDSRRFNLPLRYEFRNPKPTWQPEEFELRYTMSNVLFKDGLRGGPGRLCFRLKHRRNARFLDGRTIGVVLSLISLTAVRLVA